MLVRQALALVILPPILLTSCPQAITWALSLELGMRCRYTSASTVSACSGVVGVTRLSMQITAIHIAPYSGLSGNCHVSSGFPGSGVDPKMQLILRNMYGCPPCTVRYGGSSDLNGPCPSQRVHHFKAVSVLGHKRSSRNRNHNQYLQCVSDTPAEDTVEVSCRATYFRIHARKMLSLKFFRATSGSRGQCL